MPRRVTASRSEPPPATPFYFGFIVAGMATVLLGPILPILSARWLLTDLQAGSLFAAQFAASTVGAVLASHFRHRCVVFGYASIAAGLAALALGSYGVVLLAFALLGIGLGSATTATNLIFGTKQPTQRGTLLTRVNFFWGIGAVLGPQLVAVADRTGMIRLLVLGLSLSALAVFAVFIPLLRFRESRQQTEQEHSGVAEKPDLPTFVLFSLLLFLYVGGETAIFGWIATYAHRFANLSPAQSSSFVSVFWLAIVLGRAILPLLFRFISELTVLIAGVVAALIGVSILLFPHSAAISLASVAFAGLGCAPVFPLATARLLARIGDSRHAGWIFAICGSGAAVLPWMTGLLSAHTGSLRAAFIVPLAAMAGVLLLVFVESMLPLPHSGKNASAVSC
ncbi:MAG TPA: MFS transporter [Silvibacterium sp.]|nr:MFS transporter [Silvibacterium sp.]